jgi:DNA-binding NarL/FixJ family response regulator
MTGGTLVITRDINNHSYYQKRLEAVGFPCVTTTDVEKDALFNKIRNTKPAMLLMDARFYQCCTPFLMGELKQSFPQINMTAVAIGEYPADLAMYFIVNGVKSYMTTYDGFEIVDDCLRKICKGREYVSPAVEERIKMRAEKPQPAGKITDKQYEVMRLVCNGWKDLEIADVLHISRSTVDNHKTDIFRKLNVTDALELVHVALKSELFTLDELCFRHKDLTLNPVPENMKKGRCKVH